MYFTSSSSYCLLTFLCNKSALLLHILHLFTVQSLASPAYLHYIATTTTSEGQSLLLCPRFKAFLKYLYKTWSEPEYSRYIIYPNSLYFLEILIVNDAFCRELAQVPFRNFCHQQQFFTWQNRFATLYGSGTGGGGAGNEAGSGSDVQEEELKVSLDGDIPITTTISAMEDGGVGPPQTTTA